MKTTDKHFAYFKERCRFWSVKFGLDEWDFYFFHGEPPISHTFAGVEIHYRGCNAGIYLARDWEHHNVTKAHLDATAKHEMVHILIANLNCLVGADFLSEDEAKKAEESLVVKLCKLL